MRELAILLESLELALHHHTDYEITLAGNSDTGWLEISAAAPDEATIPYYFSYGEFPAEMFRINCTHRGFPTGLKVLGADEIRHGSYLWLYVTNRDKLSFRCENLDSQTRTCRITMWHLNVRKLEQLDIIRMVCWEYMAPASIMLAMAKGYSPPFEHLPEIKRFLEAKYSGLRW